MHGGEMLIPILVPLGFFAMIFGIVYMRTKENLAMLERGMNPKEWANRPAPYRNLKWGLLLVGSGLGLLIAYFVDLGLSVANFSNTTMRNNFDNDHAPLYFSLIAIGGGIGLIISYKMEMKELRNRTVDYEQAERPAISTTAPSEL